MAAVDEDTYRERLTPPWWLWGAAVIAAASLAIAYAAMTTLLIGALAGVVSLAIMAGLLVRTTTTVTVADGVLSAGAATIPVDLLGPPTALTADEAALLRGRAADARAWMVLRGWIPEAVRVDVHDPADDTPYWYISSRHAVRLAASISAAQRTAH